MENSGILEQGCAHVERTRGDRYLHARAGGISGGLSFMSLMILTG